MKRCNDERRNGTDAAKAKDARKAKAPQAIHAQHGNHGMANMTIHPLEKYCDQSR